MDLTEISEAVLSYCAADGVLLTDDLTQVEEALLAVVRRIGAKAVELQLARQRLGYGGASRPCACGQRQSRRAGIEHRPKTIATQMGSIQIRRAYYRCRHCGESALPYDQRIGLGAGPESVGLAQAAALLGIHDTFAASSETLYRLIGQRLSESTIERLTEAIGGVAAQQEEQRAAGMSEWKSPLAEASPETLYVAVDGVPARRDQDDGWHEAKCVACYWEDPDGERQTRYAVRFEGAAVPARRDGIRLGAGVRLRTGVGQEGRAAGRRGGMDLEPHRRAAEGSGLSRRAGMDWYHALEHVWACGRVLHGEDTDETKRWVEEIETLLWEGQVRAILERLRAEHAGIRAKTQRAALQALLTYVENQDDRLAYDRFRAAGFDIGSGRVEAACKHVLAIRMKRCGMRWSKAGSQNVLSLRTAWLDGQWDHLRKTHPLRRAA